MKLVQFGLAYSPNVGDGIIAECMAHGAKALRPGLTFEVPFTRAMIGQFDVDLAQEFFQGFVNHAQVTLHIDNLRGENAHHQCETVFKAFGRALRMAVAPDDRMGQQLPSTKEAL